MNTENGIEIEVDYNDDDKHGLHFAGEDVWFSCSLSKKDLNRLIQTLIEYTQTNEEWHK